MGKSAALLSMKILRSVLLLCATVELQGSPYLEQRIAYARAAIQKEKTNPQGYSDLAIASARRARETCSCSFTGALPRSARACSFSRTTILPWSL